ncbi:MAG TPA: antibiotic biosynthesis monooxygenase [Anaerolineales bacterium]|nr:antibiotic biosynthesis monooxygenase [Anaerolineales bacterium]
MPFHQTASFVVRKDALEVCQNAIREFVEYVRENEPDTLLYTSLQQKENPTRFIHYFIFRDEKAREIHSSSEAVDHFTSILYPNLVAPVEFTEYNLFVTTK